MLYNHDNIDLVAAPVKLPIRWIYYGVGRHYNVKFAYDYTLILGDMHSE